MTLHDNEDLPWDDVASEYDGPEDDESLVNAWKELELEDA